MAKTSKKKTMKTATARRQQAAEKKTVLSFTAGSVAARILGVLLDGRDHTFKEILRGAKPKSEKQIRNNSMPYLARHGKKTGLYELTLEDDKYRLTVPASSTAKNVA
jgi:hypothetical protein